MGLIGGRKLGLEGKKRVSWVDFGGRQNGAAMALSGFSWVLRFIRAEDFYLQVFD